MIIESQARNARQLDDGIWRAELTLLEVQLIDPSELPVAEVSVVICSEAPEFDPEKRTLSVRWGDARVVVMGRTDGVVIIQQASAERAAPAA